MRPASEVLREGKAALMQRGWTRYMYEDADGKVCMLGALNVAEFGEGNAMRAGHVSPAEHHLESIVHERDPYYRSVSGFNDAPFRTFNEVMDVYDLAEKRALIAEEAA